VARAIDFEMKKHGVDYVLLDATAPRRDVPEGALPDHLRTLHALGIDIAASRSRWCRRRTTPAAAS
jgi:L-aspartate oxidase